YTIKYYKDAVSEDNFINETKVSDAVFNSNITVDKFAFLSEVPGYKGPGTVDGNLKVQADDNQVITVVYGKADITYKINYYIDEVSDSTLQYTTSDLKAEFGSQVEIPLTGHSVTGYKSEGKVVSNNVSSNNKFTITADAANNVINVVYEKD